jgi:hypothetical protein
MSNSYYSLPYWRVPTKWCGVVYGVNDDSQAVGAGLELKGAFDAREPGAAGQSLIFLGGARRFLKLAVHSDGHH